MNHYWWWTTLLINLLERIVKRDPLVNGWLAAFDSWRQNIERGKVFQQFMKLANSIHTAEVFCL